MSEQFNLSEYMSAGIENIVKSGLKASIKNPKETAFLLKYALHIKFAKDKREILGGIPPFIMASVASNCNLYCKGCYARANNNCSEKLQDQEVSKERWEQIFNEAKELGIAFILLLGGEPLMRKKVIEKAAAVKEIVFPVFTNGTMLDESYVKLFDKNRNIVPMISIEGDKSQTDGRRGTGTYNSIMTAMNRLNKKGILFGGSITVTTENILTVTSRAFIQQLFDKGVRALVFSEYVPVTKETRNLAPTDKERMILEQNIRELRSEFENMIFLSFPGDEKYTGGCLAAGRGFFHINAKGDAEPCPFSPYSDINLKKCSLMQALESPLFRKLKVNEMLLGEHDGGCLLFEKEAEVKSLIH